MVLGFWYVLIDVAKSKKVPQSRRNDRNHALNVVTARFGTFQHLPNATFGSHIGVRFNYNRLLGMQGGQRLD